MPSCAGCELRTDYTDHYRCLPPSRGSAITRKSARGREFAALAYQILITEKRARIGDVAARMSLTYATLHSRLINRIAFTADEICALLQVLPDARLVSCLLRDTRYIAVDRHPVHADLTAEDNLRAGALRMLIEASDVAEAIEEAIADRRIDHREALRIQDEIETAERAIASLRHNVIEASRPKTGSVSA